MTAYPAWTPAPRPGIIPLHPLTFGTILGRSFSALRHNPRVLLGFAIGVQAAVFLAVVAGTGGIAFAAFSRLDTVRPGTDEFDAILTGAGAITLLGGIVLGLIGLVVQVIVQGVVIAEVAHATLAERLRVGGLWQRVKPAAWRLIGWSLAVAVTVLVVVGALVFLTITIGTSLGIGPAIALTVLLVLGSIPLTLWLSVKLLLVPSVLVLEHSTIRAAITRSWTLVRGRFWPALGVIVLISFIFNALGQVVSLPATFAIPALTSIFAPTGDPSAGIAVTLIITVVTYAVAMVVQAVALVVTATAGSLVYIDCRMRKEGLDLDLLAYVERRDAGDTVMADPWAPRPDRMGRHADGSPVWQRPVPSWGWGAPPGAPVAQGYPAPSYTAPPQQPPYVPQPPYGAPGQTPPYGYAPPQAPQERTPTQQDWTAPGADPRSNQGDTSR